MKLDKKDLLLYAVTDRHWLGDRTLYEVVKESLDGGATFIQLREKNLDQEHFLEEAKELKKLCAEYKVPFVINQDPRKLWKNLDVDWENMPDPKYINEDTQTEYIKVESLEDGTPQKDIVAASKRGRSHAQEAKPRDDHFALPIPFEAI